jgi:Na+/glutamate symporter
VATKWFSRFGWFYLPASVAGGVLCILAALFCFTVFRAVDMHSHSVSDTLYGIFPFFACTFLLLDWVARRTSGDPA